MLRKWEMVVDTHLRKGKVPAAGPRYFWTRWGAEGAARNMNRVYNDMYGGIYDYGIFYRIQKREHE